jgi:hypothetical protein
MRGLFLRMLLLYTPPQQSTIPMEMDSVT